jgi:hypothetical protein
MEWRRGRRVCGVAFVVCRPVVLAVFCAFALAACETAGQSNLSAAQPRGASVAFDSIDGLPPEQFQTLVKDLNDEAQSRRLAVISREKTAAYRVRGYLAAEIEKGKTTVSWVWDVFDTNQQRALRITGSQRAGGHRREGWAAVDDATLHSVAHTSMDQLAAFLTSPAVAPATSPKLALAAVPPASSPEAAGIFRIFHAHADPLSAQGSPPADNIIVPTPASDLVPLPRPRPPLSAAVSAGKTLTLAAARQATP